MAGYVGRAARIASGADLNRYDDYEPTGTQLLLAGPLSLLGSGRAGLWGGAFLWAGLSSLVPLATWRWSRLLLGARTAAAAAALCALWPLLILHAGYFLAETPASALLMCALWAAESARRGPHGWRIALIGGLLAGAAVATRGQLVLNALIATVGLLRSPRRMVLAWAVGAVVLVGAVVAFNSLAAERWVGLSENAGMTFFQGQCDVAYVSGGPSTRPFYFKLTGPAQLHRGRSFAFPGVEVYSQSFFRARAFDCIKADGLGHAGLLVRHVADMAATTVPWPEYDDGGAVRRVADASNRLMAAWLVLLGVLGLVARWRRIVFPRAALVPAAHLACAVVVAIVFLGDPRLRLLYEPFALTLLAAFLVGLVRQVRGDRRT
jgi:hypothetical protein